MGDRFDHRDHRHRALTVPRSLLESVARGDVSPAVALEKLKHFAYEPVGFAP